MVAMVVAVSLQDGHVFRTGSEVAMQCGSLHAHLVDMSGMLLDYDVNAGFGLVVFTTLLSYRTCRPGHALTKVLD